MEPQPQTTTALLAGLRPALVDVAASTHLPISHRARLASTRTRALAPLSRLHGRTPYIRTLPLPALLIIALLVLVNLIVWAICALIIVLHHPQLMSTAALAYSLGLRHALDADHISAIDLMTRRLIASGQRPVTVGTFFSLGHSTIVVITSIVVAATAAGVKKKFDGISTVGSIIGSGVSASFLIVLGLMNGYILYRLVLQLRKIFHMHPNQSQAEAWKIEGGGVLFRILKKLFKVIDRPWKMYPLGVLFGLGFDTSSEIALLGISSIQGAKGTNIWLILVFPVLFTVGMCLVDTIDGALMLALYVKPMDVYGETKREDVLLEEGEDIPDNLNDGSGSFLSATNNPSSSPELRTETDRANQRAKDPIAFLYYSIILTVLTVVVALVIGTIQLLTLILNVVYPNGPEDPFWNGVAVAGDNYEVIGGSICGSFIVVGLASVVAYKPWRRWAEAKRARRFEVEGDGRREEDVGEVNVMDLGSTKSSSGNEERLENRKDTKNVGADRVEELDDRISSHVTEPL
jgi:nickel/cobalt transporter (NiCoT) family protein